MIILKSRAFENPSICSESSRGAQTRSTVFSHFQIPSRMRVHCGTLHMSPKGKSFLTVSNFCLATRLPLLKEQVVLQTCKLKLSRYANQSKSSTYHQMRFYQCSTNLWAWQTSFKVSTTILMASNKKRDQAQLQKLQFSRLHRFWTGLRANCQICSSFVCIKLDK